MEITVRDDILAKAKKVLKKKNEEWDSGVCCGDTMTLEGVLSGNKFTGCHSSLSDAFRKRKKDRYCDWGNTNYTPDAEPFLCLSCYKHDHEAVTCSKEAMDAFITWMANDSPFAEFVLNKDDLTDGIILLCGPGALQHAEAMWVCKSLRYSTESGASLDSWFEMVKAGVYPVLALLVATTARVQKGASFGFMYESAHVSVFSHTLGGFDIKALIEERVAKNPDHTYTVFQADKRTDSLNHTFKSFVKPVMKDDGWGGKVESYSESKTAFTDNVLKWQGQFTDKPYVFPYADSSKAPEIEPDLSKSVYLDLDL